MSPHADVWNALPLPAVSLDAGGRIETANAAAETFLNRAQRALAGREADAALGVEGGLGTALERVRRTEAPLTLHDARMAPPGVTPQRCDLHVAPNDDGFVVLMAPGDVSGRLSGTRDTRGAARSAVGMAEMLAHEIKNPLAGITGAAQLLGMGLEGEDRELTDLIVAESRRIVSLLEEVERFGDLSPPDLRPVNLHDVLDRARRSAAVGFAAHMEIEERYDPSLPFAWADPDRLLQVALNLLKNAAEAGAQGGRITLRTYYDPGYRVRRPDRCVPVPLQVEIADDGPGIPEDIRATMFEPFVSGRENGTGLGLALVAKIMAEHDGLVALESRPGRTAFRLSLPMPPRTPNP
ncbi:nitrogen regulation protein NR(II) [Jannaschia sp. W003]|uniref:two-component system sensor histidine kinase NtrB n=1 Tax=Jannaschia sp. W003 TaxID=2867012 RepID=UPI0021A3A4FC|nr:ATP-binding protein [Jannaschia sp. W003]UWQ20491.1 PAS domain-containing protein [Jannaschia sp. W003]